MLCHLCTITEYIKDFVPKVQELVKTYLKYKCGNPGENFPISFLMKQHFVGLEPTIYSSEVSCFNLLARNANIFYTLYA